MNLDLLHRTIMHDKTQFPSWEGGQDVLIAYLKQMKEGKDYLAYLDQGGRMNPRHWELSTKHRRLILDNDWPSWEHKNVQTILDAINDPLLLPRTLRWAGIGNR